ncbi:MAG: hypothetical protein AAF430_25610 [Myxococcota bacterium]
MNRKALADLRNDRRLLNRRGWMTADERGQLLEGLPDVGAKSMTLGDATDDPAEEEAPAVPQAPLS